MLYRKPASDIEGIRPSFIASVIAAAEAQEWVQGAALQAQNALIHRKGLLYLRRAAPSVSLHTANLDQLVRTATWSVGPHRLPTHHHYRPVYRKILPDEILTTQNSYSTRRYLKVCTLPGNRSRTRSQRSNNYGLWSVRSPPSSLPSAPTPLTVWDWRDRWMNRLVRQVQKQWLILPRSPAAYDLGKNKNSSVRQGHSISPKSGSRG